MNFSNNNEQHQFAFYYPEATRLISRVSKDMLCTIDDRVLCHRIMHVLRLKNGESCVLFDAHKHINCFLESINERTLQVKIKSFGCNTQYAPHITFLLPLIKKEAFEQAIYSLTELGVNTIQLVTTKKTQRAWGGQKERERVERIIQTAAEQSKYFALPVVHEPLPLEIVVQKIHADALKIFFDPEGCKIQTVITTINNSRETDLYLLVGPEGDLTHDEKSCLEGQGFLFCQLTPTILRAQQAVTVALGALRSLMRL